MKIYIANLDSAIDTGMLEKMFAAHGNVSSVEVVKDVFTGQSRGFGYVEMEDASAINAIAALNGTEVEGLQLTVEPAPPERRQGGSYKVGKGGVNIY